MFNLFHKINPMMVISCIAFAIILLATPSAFPQSIMEMPVLRPYKLISSTPVGTTSDVNAVGVEVAGDYAYVSLHASAKQVVVNVKNPYVPQVLSTTNPNLGDQWNDALIFNDCLYTGHRGGYLNMMDVCNPSAGLPTVSSLDTSYHFKGLAGLNEGGKAYFFYSESEAYSSTGGLMVFEVQDGSLVQVDSALSTELDGAAVVVTSDGQWAYQIDGGNRPVTSVPVSLNWYDVTDKTNISLSGNIGLGCTDQCHDGDLVISPDENYLFAAAKYDGLKVIDISDKANPVWVNTYGDPGIRFSCLVYRGKTHLICLEYRQSDSTFRIVERRAKNPDVQLPKMRSTKMTMSSVKDIFAANGFLYIAGRSADQVPLLQIWGK